MTLQQAVILALQASIILTVFGFVVALKRAVERATERYCERRRAKKLRALERYMAMTARA